MTNKPIDRGALAAMQDESVFSVLCGNVQTSMITLNNTLHEVGESGKLDTGMCMAGLPTRD